MIWIITYRFESYSFEVVSWSEFDVGDIFGKEDAFLAFWLIAPSSREFNVAPAVRYPDEDLSEARVNGEWVWEYGSTIHWSGERESIKNREYQVLVKSRRRERQKNMIFSLAVNMEVEFRSQ